MMKISVCGCGWLGLPLARSLVARGYEVYGTQRDPSRAAQLAEFGIRGVPLTLPLPSPQAELAPALARLLAAEILVIAVPPGRQEGSDAAFVAKVKSLSQAAQAQGCRRVIFVSTTSVYGDVTGAVDEATQPKPNTASGRAHAELEQWLRRQWQQQLVVLRLSGLIGPGRHPVKYLAGRSGIANGGDPVNLIHLDDCIAAIEAVIGRWPAQPVLHLAAPTHPSRAAYYTQMAQLSGLPLPEFQTITPGGGKWIDARQTCAWLGLTLAHPDLLQLAPELSDGRHVN
ncbi:NAD-dependent epimerase/dehydratase family protein [Photobacterium atrarenae]|uniref:NAD-dependent epimerase/dehydratase family protein n=1 Tax=Photobacterium atrarenae TaxID=865757 RepID=A0ABY5GJE0_9GAMM|nr:NAD-dependent epimerase/dehydratase family protein [Photobacterium atrarenae]UTV28692.1 NAD-dependent epimerase/dehydratase family protein [Photobacterium atrarenae]